MQAATDIILLDRALARYGPETKEARALLQRSVAATVDRFWPTEGVRRITIDPNASPVEALAEKIEELSPHDETQRLLRSQALTMALEVGRTRLLLFENLGSSIPLLQVSGVPLRGALAQLGSLGLSDGQDVAIAPSTLCRNCNRHPVSDALRESSVVP